MRSLITAYEIVQYGPVAKTYSTNTVCSAIANKERTLFKKCLGLDFYKTLLADKIVYTGVTTYNDELTYNLDDKVLLDGTMFISKINGNNTSPAEETTWKIAPKFTNIIHEELWNDYLKYYLSYTILSGTVIYSTFQADVKGITYVKIDSTGIATVDLKSFFTYQNKLRHDGEEYYDNMVDFINDNKEYFPDIKFENNCGDLNTCKPKSRNTRIAFRQ